jgi:hypothetical protein
MSEQGAGDSNPPDDDGGDDTAADGGPPSWLIPALVAVVLVLAAVVAFLLMRDDGDDEVSASTTSSSTSTSSSTTSSSTSTTSTSLATTTTAAPTTTTANTPVTADPAQCRVAGSDPANPEPAAQAVFVAWTRGDTACAAELMTDDALDELFARDGSGATDEFQGCFEQDEPDPHMDCAWTYPGGSTHYLMNLSPTDGWQVFDVEQIAD